MPFFVDVAPWQRGLLDSVNDLGSWLVGVDPGSQDEEQRVGIGVQPDPMLSKPMPRKPTSGKIEATGPEKRGPEKCFPSLGQGRFG
ncbi:hypothetical protein AA102526_2611 [Asaia lannensis NBRC 102526]|nr:hypothetical protein AA102526_2611 [Asaia lannensis NBRC 102526]